MPTLDVPTALDRMLDPVCELLTPEVATRLAALRASPAAQSRLDELAAGHREGGLSPDDQAEYAALVQAGNLIAVLQGKARAVLAGGLTGG